MEDKYNLLIKDPIIEPYFIRVKEESYELYKRTKREGKLDIDQFLGCYTNFRNIILGISRLQSIKPGTIKTLEEYLKEYEKQTNLLINKIPEIKL